MELEFNRQLIVLQNDLINFKSSLSPIYQFIQDIQDIRKKHHISQANSVSNYSLLLLDIKEDILREITQMNRITEEKLNSLRADLTDSIDRSTKEFDCEKDDLKKLKESLKETNIGVLNAGNLGGECMMYIKEIKRELDRRATLSNLEEVKTTIRTMTPQSSFDALKTRVTECVTIYQFQEVEKTIKNIKKKLLDFMTIQDTEKKLKDFTDQLTSSFEISYVTNKAFEKHKASYDLMFTDVNTNILLAKDYASKLDKSSKDKIMVVQKALESRPWKTELAKIEDHLSKMMPKEELLGFVNDTKAKVVVFSENLQRFKTNLELFGKVVERFDEILLDKAEKDQLQKIENIIETLASVDEFNDLQKSTKSFTKDLEQRFQSQCSAVEKIKSSFDYILERFEMLKKENFDVTNLSNTLLEFRETLNRKAEKQDIYEIYDNMCKRIEYLEINEILRVLKKQVEQGIALVFALCRTLVKNGEPPAQVKKERYELLKHLNSLMNWISGADIISLNCPSFRIQEGVEEEERSPTRQSVLYRRRSAMTTKESRRMHVDFPKLG